ncbi:MAG TPA: TonB-dependent receptor [Alphaproteobacteria bacterium]|jgi:outer membrane receptor protein involved in Fe transport|nr:TonB-dependent receptor [Alphaproteobacteria bacterium]
MLCKFRSLTSVFAIMIAAAPFTARAAEGDTPQPAGTPAADQPMQEIVVTATRRAEAITKVPISMMAIDQATLTKQGVKDVSDLARLVPGLNLETNDDDGDSSLSIRGIVSDVGAATVGVYIDDAPVQSRQEAVSTNPYPKIYDLDRVEVLRGPQGTLFGAGSEGGTLRFITPEASLQKFSGTANAEVAVTDGGSPSWELGGAVGGPLVEDKLGFRASGWFREDGGYTDRLDPATHALTGTDTNSSGSTVAQLKFKFAPTDSLVIAPSLYYQDVRQDDKSVFTESAGPFNDLAKIPQPRNDHFILPSLSIGYDFDAFSVKSITTYLSRTLADQYDSTEYLLADEIPAQYTLLPTDKNFFATANYREEQLNFSQELRFTSNADADSPLTWVGGLFYQHARSASESYYKAPRLGEVADFASEYYYGVPSSTANYFGEGLLPGKLAYFDHYVLNDTDMAVYGNATYEVLDGLKLSAGLRVARSGFSYFDGSNGPWGPAAPTEYSGSSKETPVTPRFGITYQLAPDQMIYATVAKGYRTGGANEPVPSNACRTDLNQLGVKNAPVEYDSDSVWSYEAGAKGRFFDGQVLLEGSIFWIDWSQIQQAVDLVRCGYYYIANLGEAASRGFDLQAEWTVTKRLTLSGTAGFTDARYVKSLLQDGQILAKVGDSLATPEWSATLAAEYTFPIFEGTDAYGRIDYEFSGPYYNFGSDQTFGYDATTRDQPATHFVSLRVGAKQGGWDWALKVDNLLNSRTLLSRYHQSNDSPFFTDTTFRPLTVGLSAQYKF